MSKYAKAVIIDKNAPKEAIKKIKSLNITPILSAEIPNIISGVSTHSDMQIHPLEDNLFVCEPTLYDYYRNCLEKYSVDLIKGDTFIKSTYPHDIAYNVAKIGKTVIHNTKYTDTKILNYYTKNNYRIINVNQGYSNCSICHIGENIIITSDRGIYTSIEKCGFEVHFAEGEIQLEGASNGLFGGCCGYIGKNTIAFCGDVYNYTSGNNIVNLFKACDIDIIILCQQKLKDIGSIIPIY